MHHDQQVSIRYMDEPCAADRVRREVERSSGRLCMFEGEAHAHASRGRLARFSRVPAGSGSDVHGCDRTQLAGGADFRHQI